jgi:hypothetical protein
MLVKQNYKVLQYINDKTDELCTLAIQQNIAALECIDSKTPELLEFAFQQNPAAIQYFDVQPLDKCLIAVQKNGYYIRLIKLENQTPEICIAAVTQNGNAIGYIKHLQTPEMCMIAIKNSQNKLYSIESIQHPTMEHFVEFCYRGGSRESVPIEYREQVEKAIANRTVEHLRQIDLNTFETLRKRLCKPVHVGTQTQSEVIP